LDLDPVSSCQQRATQVSFPWRRTDGSHPLPQQFVFPNKHGHFPWEASVSPCSRHSWWNFRFLFLGGLGPQEVRLSYFTAVWRTHCHREKVYL